MAALVLVACAVSTEQTPAGPDLSFSTSTGQAAGTASAQQPTKVLLIMEENTEAEDVLGSGNTHFLDSVSDQAARVTRLEADYPTVCPSLPAYLLLTSGSTHRICDDLGPKSHQLEGVNIFAATADSGREWRVYAEGMATNCERTDSDDGRYAVRHTAAPYYTSEAGRCENWQVPLGRLDEGALNDGLSSGLEAFSLVVPDLCHDMHGAKACTGDRVEEGDAWLADWLPRILASPDYRAGDLLVVLTWDEGSLTSNDIATLLFHPALAGATVDHKTDHCDTLRTMGEVLKIQPIGCAAEAAGLLAMSN